MKIQFRKQIGNILFYGFITKTQKATGITSKTDRENYHYILWDFDNVEYHNMISALEKVMIKYNINGLVVMSDKVNSYRAFSSDIVDYKTLLKIILDTDGVDRMFFKWTVKRGYATIRISDKKNRPENLIIGMLGRMDIDFIKEKFKFVDYDTDE